MSDRGLQWAYLDLEAAGVTRESQGVSITSGGISLAAVAASPETLGSEAVEEAGEATLTGLVSIGVDRAGNVYVSDTKAGTVLRVDGCDGSRRALPCLELDRPGGVAVGRRGELYVADTGNHRIVVLDLESGQTIGIWGTADPYGPPRPDSAPGLLDEPTDVAVDSEGALYVVDRGNRRVQRFTADGALDGSFWEALSQARPSPRAPEAVAVVLFDEEIEERVLVLDRETGTRARLLVYDREGGYDAGRTGRIRVEAEHIPPSFQLPLGGITAGRDRIYVGDPRSARVLAFDGQGRFLGTLPCPAQGVAGLELDCRGRLVIHSGQGTVTRFSGLGPVATGWLRAGPFALPTDADGEQLTALRLEVEKLPDGAQFRLYAWLGGDDEQEPPPLPPLGSGDGGSGWTVGAANAAEVVVEGDATSSLWIGLRLSAGSAGPVLGRFRVVTGLESWLYRLPAIYQRDGNKGFLERFLAGLGAGLEEEESRIDELPLLFDADAAPDRPSPPWLEWLAGWLAFDVAAVRVAGNRRRAVAAAFGLSGRRGTAEGLRELIELMLGAHAWISEPGRAVDPWTLDGSMMLGFDTALVPAEAQGAVLGTTATLDASHLIRDEEFGAPLFDDLAHRFCVGVHARDVADPDARGALERLVERERPAHTVAHVCVVEPQARVGFQARVGVDAVVAAGLPPLVLGERELGDAGLFQRARRQQAVGITAIGQGGRGG